jgi:hypothetical protein
LDRIITKNNVEIVFCSDGGLKLNNGGLGIVASIDKVIVLETFFKLPRNYNDYTSHRCEAMRLLNAILIFKTINHYRKESNHTKNYQTSAIFYCDNKAVTITANKHQYAGTSTKDYYKADFDIISKINMIWTSLIKDCAQVKINHILGHQDRKKKKSFTPRRIKCTSGYTCYKSSKPKENLWQSSGICRGNPIYK